MGGGLLQVIATGPQDINLTNNPQISFFKQVYRKYTNFGIEPFRQEFIGHKKMGKRLRCKIEKKGDLLGKMFLVFELGNCEGGISTDAKDLIPKTGLRLIEYVEIEIGGLTIDKQYAEWMDIWFQLTHTRSKYEMLQQLIGDTFKSRFYANNSNIIYVPLLFWFTTNPGLALPLVALQYHDIVVYLKIPDKIKYFASTSNNNFRYPVLADKDNQKIVYTKYSSLGVKSWYRNYLGADPCPDDGYIDRWSFFQHPGQWNRKNLDPPSTYKKDEVYIGNIGTPVTKLTGESTESKDNYQYKWLLSDYEVDIKDVYLICEFIFLDPTEIKKMLTKPLDFLITQTQSIDEVSLPSLSVLGKNAGSCATKNAFVELDFNHPVKEIFWGVYPSMFNGQLYYKNMDFTNTNFNIELYANNNRLNKITDPNYYSMVSLYQHHECGGIFNNGFTPNYNGGFNVYSFSLSPEKSIPTGSLNFSRLNSFIIQFDYKKSRPEFSNIDESFRFAAHAINYNILRIEKGEANLVYSS